MKLKEIAPYLAYELKVYDQKWNITLELNLNTIGGTKLISVSDILARPMNFKYIMHPLSDLTKPCLEGGKIPIMEMSGYSDILGLSFVSTGYDHKTLGFYALFQVGVDYLRFDLPADKSMRLCDADWLYAHHFWLGDQSRFGQDIIDINTLNNQKL